LAAQKSAAFSALRNANLKISICLQKNSGWTFIVPFLLLVLALFIGPITNILWLSVSEPKLGLDNYQTLFISESIPRILWTTLRVCSITTIFSVVF
jgi:putative spermidine/putrescine transport system permease protein